MVCTHEAVDRDYRGSGEEWKGDADKHGVDGSPMLVDETQKLTSSDPSTFRSRRCQDVRYRQAWSVVLSARSDTAQLT